jgi:hypothetical protein
MQLIPQKSQKQATVMDLEGPRYEPKPSASQENVDERFNAASLKDSLEEQGIAINKNDLATLIDNMRSLTKQWRSSIGERRELVFYVDSC